MSEGEMGNTVNENENEVFPSVNSESMEEENLSGDVTEQPGGGPEIATEQQACEEVEKVKDDEEIHEDIPAKENSKLRIVEGGLNFILKNFEDMGEFYGLIISYDEPYFKVVYEDGDCEELEVLEVEDLLVSMASVPEHIITSLKKIAKTIAMGGSAANTVMQRESSGKTVNGGKTKKISGVEKWNNYVLKSFGDQGEFYGLIISYEDPFYKVVYEDGDCEDLEYDEVNEYKVPAKSVNSETKKMLRGCGLSISSMASPSDFSKSTVTQDKQSKKRIQNSLAKPSKKKRSNSEAADENPKRLTLAGVKDWKYHVLKSFGDMGDYYGLIISFDKPFYKVVYEDGDCEDLDKTEVRALLVPPKSVPADVKATLRGFGKSISASASPSDFVTQEKIKNKTVHESTTRKGKLADNMDSPVSTHLSTSPNVNKFDTSEDNQQHILLSNSKEPLSLREPLDTYDNYVSKTFFGFGMFYGLLVGSQGPFYKVIYSDGDSEELSLEEVIANLADPSSIPTKMKSTLRSHARVYKSNPVPFQNETVGDSPGDNTAKSNNDYRDVPEDNIYQQYVGRSFIDLDENITFRVKSVCLHMDYDVLLFKYYDEFQFLSDPECFDDPDKYEYSACSEMLKADSWCKWTAESALNEPTHEKIGKNNTNENLEKDEAI